MANNKSQGQFASWNQHEDTVTNEFSIAFDNNIDLQENLQHEVHSENLLDSFRHKTLNPWECGRRKQRLGLVSLLDIGPNLISLALEIFTN